MSELYQVLRETERLPLKERQERVWRFIDKILARLGVPEDPDNRGHRIELMREVTSPLSGVFRPKDWLIVVSDKLLVAGAMSREKMAALADILGHELAHAEQLFCIACFLAGTGRTAELAELDAAEHILSEAQSPTRPKLGKATAKRAERWYRLWIAPAHLENRVALRNARVAQGEARKTRARIAAELQAAQRRRPPAPSKEISERRKALAIADKELEARKDRVKKIHDAAEKLPLDRQCQAIGHALGKAIVERVGKDATQ